MEHDALQQLLHDADRDAPSLREPGFAQRIRERYIRQRRRFRIGSAGACLMLVAGIAIVLSTSRHQPEQIVTVAPTHQIELTIDDRVHEQTVARLTTKRPVAPFAATADVKLQRDRAALILVYDAERHAKENRTSDAVALYRRAIDLFPRSHWADVARERLKAMQT